MSVSDAKDDAKLPTAERCMQGEVIFVRLFVQFLDYIVVVLVLKSAYFKGNFCSTHFLVGISMEV